MCVCVCVCVCVCYHYLPSKPHDSEDTLDTTDSFFQQFVLNCKIL